jgi:acetylglutamate kinase
VNDPLVVKLGGALLDDAANFPGVFEALVHMHQVHPCGLVIVHGGGKAVDRQLDRLGIATERREGIRITPPEAVEQVAAVLAGTMNTQLLGLLLSRGASAVGLTLTDGHLARAAKATRFPFDPGRVGELVGGDGMLLRHLLAGGYLPVLSSIATCEAGGILNVNADDAAAQIAGIVGASGLLLLTDVPGVRGADGNVVAELDADAAERLIADGTVTGGMIAKVRGAVAAAESGGVPVVIASWADPKALEALASGGAVGTRVLPRTLAPARHVREGAAAS